MPHVDKATEEEAPQTTTDDFSTLAKNLPNSAPHFKILELLIRIFNFLSPGELFVAAQTCRALRFSLNGFSRGELNAEYRIAVGSLFRRTAPLLTLPTSGPHGILAAVSCKGFVAAVKSSNHKIKVVNRGGNDGKRYTLKADYAPITSLAISHGKLISTTSSAIYLWGFPYSEDTKPRLTLEQLNVKHVLVHNDTLYSTSPGEFTRWNNTTGACFHRITRSAKNFEFHSVVILNNGFWVVQVNPEHNILLTPFRFEETNPCRKVNFVLPSHDHEICTVARNSNETRIISSDKLGNFCIWDMTNGTLDELLHDINIPNSPGRFELIEPCDDQFFICTFSKNSLYVINGETGKVFKKIFESDIQSISTEGSLITAGFETGKIAQFQYRELYYMVDQQDEKSDCTSTAPAMMNA